MAQDLDVNVAPLQATRSEAPVVVCAPHATLVDALAVYYCDAVPMVTEELAKSLGYIAKFLQVVFFSLSLPYFYLVILCKCSPDTGSYLL